MFANAMSGIPVTRELHTGLEGYYPDGRATDGRAPFLFFANVYAEYNLKVTDKYRIQLSLNVDNIFDVKTARRIRAMMNQTSAVLTDDERLAGWTYDNSATQVYTESTALYPGGRTINYMADPRFLKEMDFYPPLSARIGLKFIF
jgi:hypothetical protein